MKVKLNVRVNSGAAIYPVMVMRGFFRGERWRIDHCNTHYELHIDRRQSKKHWFMLFALRWT
jgi:hypothetical protein